MIDATFLRGPCRGGALLRPYRMHPSGFPYEGKLSAARLTDEVDSVTQTQVPHLIRHG